MLPKTICRHCHQVIGRATGHYRLSLGSRAEHDAELERQERAIEAQRLRYWLAEDHPARALRIIEHHARSQGRRFRRTV